MGWRWTGRGCHVSVCGFESFRSSVSCSGWVFGYRLCYSKEWSSLCNFAVWLFILDFTYFLVSWCVRGVLILHMCFSKFVGHLDGYVILSAEATGLFFSCRHGFVVPEPAGNCENWAGGSQESLSAPNWALSRSWDISSRFPSFSWAFCAFPFLDYIFL